MPRRTKKKSPLIFKVIFTIAVLSTPLILFSFYPNILSIRTLQIESEHSNCTDEDQIRSVVNIEGKNLLFVNSKKIEDDLKTKFFCIKVVNVQRNWPAKIKLKIVGRTAVAILSVIESKDATQSATLYQFPVGIATKSAISTASADFLIDNEGVVFALYQNQLNLPRIYLNKIISLGQKRDDDLVSNSLQILQKIKSLGIDVNSARIYSDDLLLIGTTPQILFKLDKDINEQLASLQLILNQAKINEDYIEFIDLRFDKPVVRFAPKK